MEAISRTVSKKLRLYPALSGVLLALCGLPFVLRPDFAEAAFFVPALVLDGVAVSGVLFFLAAGILIGRYVLAGRIAATLACLHLPVLLADELVRNPLAALFVLLAVMLVIAILFDVAGLRHWPRKGRQYFRLRRAGIAALAALGLGLLAWQVGVDRPGAAGGLALSCLVALLLGIRQALAGAGRGPSALVFPALAVVWFVWAGYSSLARSDFGGAALGGLLPVAAIFLFALPRIHLSLRPPDVLGLGHPQRLFVSTFFLLSLAGTILLLLPASSSGSVHVAPIDAVFTAVSAVCVTGLIVLDTPVDFSLFGQLVILTLIQLGGLGMMTFSTAAFRILGQRMSLRHEVAIARLASPRDRGRVYESAAGIVGITVLLEGLGALVLSLLFWLEGAAPGRALWNGIFTAISAFCNAGFALQSDSLVPYQNSPLVLHAVALLIIAGGLSPALVLLLPAMVRRAGRGISAQAKLSLSAALVLLVLGFGMMLAVEWDHALAGLDPLDRIHNAWFQSVTLRTAGFNSVDLAAVRPATLLGMMALMFVGGGPGGTAGGIKTTTLAILCLATLQAVRGQWVVTVFKRRISQASLQKASVVTLVFGMVLFAATSVLLLTQRMPAGTAIFEAVSALGTVGLSIGGTAALDSVGKVLVIATMFLGRVGPLSIFMLLGHGRPPDLIVRPEEEIDVG